MTTRIFFDRDSSTVEGFLTVNVDGKEVIKRIPVRSGQKGWTHSSWVRGKSPIPYGEHRLWLRPQNVGLLPGKKGIGEFWPISNTDNPRLIQEIPDGPRPVGVDLLVRWDVGWHSENALPGSAGCPVAVKQKDFNRVSALLRNLDGDYIPFIVL